MIRLFNINDYIIDTSQFAGVHDQIVQDFEQKIASFVGAKYACGVSSATNAIFLSLLNKNVTISLPSILPPVVCNAVLTSGNKLFFRDDIDWVGDSYILHDFGNYKIIDSAQKIIKNQFKKEANSQDLMLFSFYPTKPIGSYDGGIVVSDDKEKIDYFKLMTMNGTVFNEKSWKREIKQPGYKMYLNAIQAYIANKNFEKLDEKYDALTRIRNRYNSAFGITNESFHLYRLNIKEREGFLANASQHGIEIGRHYEALHRLPLYGQEKMKLEKSELESDTTISIPFNEKLSNNEIDKVIKLVKGHEYFKNT